MVSCAETSASLRVCHGAVAGLELTTRSHSSMPFVQRFLQVWHLNSRIAGLSDDIGPEPDNKQFQNICLWHMYPP